MTTKTLQEELLDEMEDLPKVEEDPAFAKVRAIVREELESFKDDLFAGFAALLETRASSGVVEDEAPAKYTGGEDAIFAVFNEAALKDPDQCQSIKHLCERTKLPKAAVLAALDTLERWHKVYSRPYFKTRLWYLVGHGPGPVKAR